MKSSRASQAPQVNSSSTGVEAKPIACSAELAARQSPCAIAAARSGIASVARYSPERLAEPGDPLRRGRGRVGLEEDRVAEGHLEVVEAVADQRLEGHGIDVVGLDALEDLVVELDGLVLRQGEQDVAEAAVRIAAVQLEMDLAEPKPAAEIDAAGPALEGVVIGLDRRGPVARPLLIQATLQHAVRISIGTARAGLAERYPSSRRR